MSDKIEDEFHNKFSDFLAAIEPKQTEQFAELTDDELAALTALRDKADALDTSLHAAMEYHTRESGAVRKKTRLFWDGVEARLKEQWPKNSKVRAVGRALYR